MQYKLSHYKTTEKMIFVQTRQTKQNKLALNWKQKKQVIAWEKYKALWQLDNINGNNNDKIKIW